jgi:hypothetical protein
MTVTGASFWADKGKGRLEQNHGKLLSEFKRIKTQPFSRVKVLGKSYLQKWPSESDASFLSESIAKACSTRKEGEELTAKHLSCQIRSDFANGRIERVDGWILSRLEARLYALSYITQAHKS